MTLKRIQVVRGLVVDHTTTGVLGGADTCVGGFSVLGDRVDPGVLEVVGHTRHDLLLEAPGIQPVEGVPGSASCWHRL